MTRELFEKETEDEFKKSRIYDFGGESGGTVIIESPLKPASHWPDYSNLQMSPQNTNDIVVISNKQLVKKKK